jgi:hypothetical protein
VTVTAEVTTVLKRLYETSVKVWDDSSDSSSGHVSDPSVWAEWIDAIEATGKFLKDTPIPYGGPVKRVPGSVVGDIQIAPDFGVGA